jgi:hypothetical protein
MVAPEANTLPTKTNPKLTAMQTPCEGLTSEGIKELLLQHVERNGELPQVREKRDEYANHRYYYKAVIRERALQAIADARGLALQSDRREESVSNASPARAANTRYSRLQAVALANSAIKRREPKQLGKPFTPR